MWLIFNSVLKILKVKCHKMIYIIYTYSKNICVYYVNMCIYIYISVVYSLLSIIFVTFCGNKVSPLLCEELHQCRALEGVLLEKDVSDSGVSEVPAGFTAPQSPGKQLFGFINPRHEYRSIDALRCGIVNQ